MNRLTLKSTSLRYFVFLCTFQTKHAQSHRLSTRFILGRKAKTATRANFSPLTHSTRLKTGATPRLWWMRKTGFGRCLLYACHFGFFPLCDRTTLLTTIQLGRCLTTDNAITRKSKYHIPNVLLFTLTCYWFCFVFVHDRIQMRANSVHRLRQWIEEKTKTNSKLVPNESLLMIFHNCPILSKTRK